MRSAIQHVRINHGGTHVRTEQFLHGADAMA